MYRIGRRSTRSRSSCGSRRRWRPADPLSEPQRDRRRVRIVLVLDESQDITFGRPGADALTPLLALGIVVRRAAQPQIDQRRGALDRRAAVVAIVDAQRNLVLAQ